MTDPDSCLICFDDITNETMTMYKRYKRSSGNNQDNENNFYTKSKCCVTCVKHMLDVSWENYVDRLKNADCEAEMRRLLELGPPINLRCSNVLESDNKIDPKEEFESLYFDNQEQSAKLKGSLIGDDRNNWIIEQQQILECLNIEHKTEIKTETVSASQSSN